jgi:predicted phage terminase large subunit-like protein
MAVLNKYKKAAIDAIIKEKQLQDALFKEKCKENLYLFNKYILKADEGSGKVELSPFHRELCNFVTDDMHKKKLILLPRGHLKSTLITVGYSIYRIIKNPSIRILILNATYQMAADFVRAIKKHLQGNPDLIRIYGNLSEGAIEWSENRITLAAAKTGDAGTKESTITGVGVDSNLVSQHYDLIIHDDVVNRDNINTREQIEKVILRYKDSLDLLEPNGQMVVIGTRWDDKDLYDWIMDKENNIIQSYNVMIKRAYEGNMADDSFKALWPLKFDQKELQARLREKGPYEFSCQYMNDPVPDEAATFRRDWFHYYEDDDLRGKLLNKFTAIDPAISLSKEADFTAMITVGIDQWGNLFVLDIVRGKFTPTQMIQEIFKIAERWHPNEIAIEDVAFQKTLAYSLREEMKRRNRHLPLTEVKPGDRTKDQRIKSLQPLYANGKVFHNKLVPNTNYLEYELAHFPRAKNDDIIDAMSYTVDLLYKPRQKKGYFEHRYLY